MIGGNVMMMIRMMMRMRMEHHQDVSYDFLIKLKQALIVESLFVVHIHHDEGRRGSGKKKEAHCCKTPIRTTLCHFECYAIEYSVF